MYLKDKMVFSRISTMLPTDLEKTKSSEHDEGFDINPTQKN